VDILYPMPCRAHHMGGIYILLWGDGYGMGMGVVGGWVGMLLLVADWVKFPAFISVLIT